MTTLIILLVCILPLPWIARIFWPHAIQPTEAMVTCAGAAVIVAGVFSLGMYSMTDDVEIINGSVASKHREHDTYTRSYSCNCTTTCRGSGDHRSCSESCSTCYEDHYTVSWFTRTTIGDISIDHKDTTNRSVYLTPDPQRYIIIQTGDPVSRQQSFTNYIKGAPDSLFHGMLALEKFKDKIPAYPSDVHDIYKVNRILPVGVNVPELQQWNSKLSTVLGKIGPSKQANAVIVMVKEADSMYAEALKAAWLGGKKNDTIIVLGVPEYPKIGWVRVISWTDSELFKVQLRKDIEAMPTVDFDALLGIIETNVSKSFVRKHMKDFEYLRDEIEPPTWVIVLALLLGMATSFGASYYFYHNDLTPRLSTTKRKY